MKNKVIWVTGASSGIGEALAQHLSTLGTKLILSSRRSAELERVKNSCQGDQKDIAILPLDLSDQDSLENAVKSAIDLFGSIDILINNGGISQRSLAEETSIEVDRKLMEVNYFGTIALSKHLLAHFIERQSGHFVTVTSLVGKFGTPYRSGYSASKHALHGFFDSLRAEIAHYNIKVTMVCPGFIKTNVSVNALTESGDKLNQMDDAQANGMEALTFAKKMTQAIASGKMEVYIGGREKFGVYLKRYLPDTFAKIIKKAKVR